MAAAVDTFLRAVMRSGLLPREQLKEALRAVPPEQRDDPRRVAEYLVSQAKLTQFQAQKLLQGVSTGLVLGPYQIEAILGRGGMGAVYLALDTRSREHVALKVLPPKKAREKERHVARFEREKALSQRVRHPHVARTHEAGVLDNVHYIAMEYIPGQTLYRLVQKEAPLPVARAARLFAEVAEALDAAHAQGVIHRDLKPSNIMVTPSDHAKILDLGMALMLGEEVQDVEVVGGKGYVVGSVDYMAPEQTRDASQVDARSDVYALGCCLYFALTGRPVFPGGEFRDKIQAHRALGPEPITNRNPAIPDGFADVVHKMLAKDPTHRYQSAAEAAAALRAWAAGGTLLPVESTGDLTYQEAVRTLMAAAPPVETAPGDEIIFHIDTTQETSSTDLSAVLFDTPPSPSEPLPQHFWWILLGLLAFWAFASCVVLLAVGLRLLLVQ